MIFVTGDEGFIGTWLCKAIEQRGMRWTGFDLQRGEDIRQKYTLHERMAKAQPDVVIHLAARAGVRMSRAYPEEYITTNVVGTQNVVDVCEALGVGKLINFSSSSVFGEHPWDHLPLTELSETNPKSLYGITKLTAEWITLNSQVPTVTLRPFTVYGDDGRRDSVLWRWIEQAKQKRAITVYGDGSSCRGYVWVQDVVDVVLRLAIMPWDWLHEDFNIGGSEVIYLRDLLATFRREWPGTQIAWLPRVPEDVDRQYADTFKAETMLGFKPEKLFFENVERILRKEVNRHGR